MPLSGTLIEAHIIDAVAERNGFTRKNKNQRISQILIINSESGDSFNLEDRIERRIKKSSEMQGAVVFSLIRVYLGWTESKILIQLRIDYFSAN